MPTQGADEKRQGKPEAHTVYTCVHHSAPDVVRLNLAPAVWASKMSSASLSRLLRGAPSDCTRREKGDKTSVGTKNERKGLLTMVLVYVQQFLATAVAWRVSKRVEATPGGSKHNPTGQPVGVWPERVGKYERPRMHARQGPSYHDKAEKKHRHTLWLSTTSRDRTISKGPRPEALSLSPGYSSAVERSHPDTFMPYCSTCIQKVSPVLYSSFFALAVNTVYII